MDYRGYKVNRGSYHDHEDGGVVCGCCLAEAAHRRGEDRWEDSHGRLYRKVRSDAKPKPCWSCAAMVDETIYQEEQAEAQYQAEQNWMNNNADAWYKPDN